MATANNDFQDLLEDILEEIPKINPNRKYWFVRTSGGDYYEDFVKGGYIAIGYNNITLKDIHIAKSPEDMAGMEILTGKIKELYKETEKRPGYVASQLVRFTYEIKKGDIVLIPSESSHTIHFGEVISTPVDIEHPRDNCPFNKRKNVSWIKSVRRSQLDSDFYKMIFSHHTVTNANEYAGIVDRTLNDFFIKGDEAHYVLDVKESDDIKAKSLFNFGLAFNLAEEFCKEEGIDVSDEFHVKVNVQSPGPIEITTISILSVIALGTILIAIAGGGFRFKYKSKREISADVKTDGIIEKMRRFLNSKTDRKAKADIVKKSLEDLKIDNPKDFIDILKQFTENGTNDSEE